MFRDLVCFNLFADSVKIEKTICNALSRHRFSYDYEVVSLPSKSLHLFYCLKLEIPTLTFAFAGLDFIYGSVLPITGSVVNRLTRVPLAVSCRLISHPA